MTNTNIKLLFKLIKTVTNMMPDVLQLSLQSGSPPPESNPTISVSIMDTMNDITHLCFRTMHNNCRLLMLL